MPQLKYRPERYAAPTKRRSKNACHDKRPDATTQRHSSVCAWHYRQTKEDLANDSASLSESRVVVHWEPSFRKLEFDLPSTTHVGRLKTLLSARIGAAVHLQRLYQGLHQGLHQGREELDDTALLSSLETVKVWSSGGANLAAISEAASGARIAPNKGGARKAEAEAPAEAPAEAKPAEESACSAFVELTLVVEPIDSELLLRRSKHVRRFITFEAWKERDALTSARRKEAREEARQAKLKEATAKQEANASAYARWVARRSTAFSNRLGVGALVVLREPTQVRLFAPGPAVQFREGRLGCSDLLTVVARGGESTQGQGGPGGRNWCEVATCLGWRCQVPSLWLLEAPKHLVEERENGLAGPRGNSAVGSGAAEVAQQHKKWVDREWRKLHGVATSKGALKKELAEVWNGLLERMDDLGLSEADIFDAVDQDGAGSLSADALSKGLSDLGLPLSAPHLATLRRGLEKRHGRVSLEEMGAALAAQRSRLEARPPANPMAKTAAVEAPDAAQESPGDEALTDEAGPKGCGEANTCDREDAENKDENTRTRKQEQAFKIWLRKKRQEEAAQRRVQKLSETIAKEQKEKAKREKWKKKPVVSAYSTMKSCYSR